MPEVSMLNLIVSGLFVAFTYGLFLWGLWLGYKGITAEAPPFREGGHAVGDEHTYDSHCRIGDKSCAEVRHAEVVRRELEVAA